MKNSQRQIKFRAWDNRQMFLEPDGSDGKLNDEFREIGGRILMQFTGLKDKNGKEIYEGDLVVCYTKDGEKVFVNPQVVEIPEWYKLIWDETNTEVVGNIYSNPELIK